MGATQETFRILCLGAHPDDVEIAMGGSILSLTARGHQVRIVDLTDGEPTPFGTSEIRKREAFRAAEILGVGRTILDFPNRFLEDNAEIRDALIETTKGFEPDFIFTPYPIDIHPDHIAAASLGRALAGHRRRQGGRVGLLRFMPLHLRMSRRPDYLNDISPHLQRKLEALRCYESQFILPQKNSLERIVVENRRWGTVGGFDAAEHFYGSGPTPFAVVEN